MARLTDNSSLALDRIRKMLNETSFGPDGKLPTERAIAEQLGISRRSVRRALEVLEAEGRVWRRQGSGTFAGPPPSDLQGQIGQIAAETDYMEVMEVRLRIEPQLAQLSALRAKGEAIERMRQILQRLDESEDSDGRELWDSAFHRQIARSAGNRFFLTIFDVVDRVRQDAAWQSIRAQARNSAYLAIYSQQHHTIFEAITRRDPVKAGEAMRQHLMTLYDNLIQQTSLGGLSDAS